MTQGEKMIWAAAFVQRLQLLIGKQHAAPVAPRKPPPLDRTIVAQAAAIYATSVVRSLRDVQGLEWPDPISGEDMPTDVRSMLEEP